MEQKIILSLKSINKEFPGTKALTDVNLDFYSGEIHALVGENGAGKSTMMNIIGGVLPPSSGEIIFEGKSLVGLNPITATKMGIGFVHQETSVCPHVSVAENVFIGRLPQKRGGMVDYNRLYSDTEQVLKRFDCDFKATEKVAGLSVAEQQVVEISKALSHNCKLLILDEPTSSLTNRETEELFKIVRQLKAEGVGIIYISHRLSEVSELCDKVTVLRDGCVIDTRNVAEVDTNAIISMMVGRKLENLYPQKSSEIGEEIFSVKNASGDRFENVSFSLRKGEILGFSGLVGAGRTELMRAICGIDQRKSGELRLQGESLEARSYRACLDKGLVYMTEDRKSEGLFLDMAVRENIVASIIGTINGMTVNEALTDAETEKYVEYMNIKVSSYEQKCNSLSGGNQQKVLLGKSMAIKPKVLIVDEPTRGIDVGAKFEVYKILRNLCNSGIGIIVVSSDLPEVIGICDRVVVMYEGKKSGELVGAEITEENVMQYAAVYREA